MKNIFVIAKNTIQEAVRDRILYGIVVFGILYIVSVLFLAKLSLGDIVMIKSFGLAGIYIFGLIITIFLGASIMHKEFERKTLYFVLSKPVSRSQLILGKFFGLFFAISITILLMALVYLGVVAYQHGGFDALGFLALFFQICEIAIFVSLLIFLSSVVAPLTATILSILVLFSGHFLSGVLQNAKEIGGVTLRGVQFLYYVFPNLEKFNIRNLSVHALSLPWSSVALTVLYAIFYCALLLTAAYAVLKRKDL